MGSNTRSYRLTPLAEADLEDIWQYTFLQWSPEQADAYVRGIVSAIAGLARGDKVGLRTDVGPEYWKYHVGLHVIYFRQSEESVDVIRILHGRMDVERHLSDDGD